MSTLRRNLTRNRRNLFSSFIEREGVYLNVTENEDTAVFTIGNNSVELSVTEGADVAEIRAANNFAHLSVTESADTAVFSSLNNSAWFAVTESPDTAVFTAATAPEVTLTGTESGDTAVIRAANNAARISISDGADTAAFTVTNGATDPNSLVFTGSQALEAPGTLNEPGPWTVCFWVLATDWVEFLFGRIWTVHAGGTDHVQIRLRWTASDDPNNNLRFVGQAGFDEGANAYLDSSDAEDWTHCFVKCTSGGDLTFGWRKQGEGSYTTATAAGSYYQDSTEMWVGGYDNSAGLIYAEIAQAIGWNRLLDNADIYDQSLQVAIIDSTSIVFDLQCDHANAGNNRAGTDWTVHGTFSSTGTGPAELVP